MDALLSQPLAKGDRALSNVSVTQAENNTAFMTSAQPTQQPLLPKSDAHLSAQSDIASSQPTAPVPVTAPVATLAASQPLVQQAPITKSPQRPRPENPRRAAYENAGKDTKESILTDARTLNSGIAAFLKRLVILTQDEQVEVLRSLLNPDNFQMVFQNLFARQLLTEEELSNLQALYTFTFHCQPQQPQPQPQPVPIPVSAPVSVPVVAATEMSTSSASSSSSSSLSSALLSVQSSSSSSSSTSSSLSITTQLDHFLLKIRKVVKEELKKALPAPVPLPAKEEKRAKSKPEKKAKKAEPKLEKKEEKNEKEKASFKRKAPEPESDRDIDSILQKRSDKLTGIKPAMAEWLLCVGDTQVIKPDTTSSSSSSSLSSSLPCAYLPLLNDEEREIGEKKSAVDFTKAQALEKRLTALFICKTPDEQAALLAFAGRAYDALYEFWKDRSCKELYRRVSQEGATVMTPYHWYYHDRKSFVPAMQGLMAKESTARRMDLAKQYMKENPELFLWKRQKQQ